MKAKWKIKTNEEFLKKFKKIGGSAQLLLKFAMEIILESDDPKKLPLTLKCPSNPDKCLLKLPDLHCIIFSIHRKEKMIEFIHCN